MSRSWQCPDADTSEAHRLGWLDEICEDGESWNKSQPGFSDWQRSLEILNGQTPKVEALEFKDFLSGRRVRTNVRTAAAGLSNIRPIWGWHAEQPYATQAEALNKTSRALYLENHWGRDIKDWLCYAMATNTGWMRPVYRRGMGGTGKGKIELFTYGQPCVLPFQMPASGNYQECYAVTLMDELPIWEAHSRFPLFQDQLKATKSQLWYATEIRSAADNNARKRMPFNPFNSRQKGEPKKTDLYIPFRYTTVIDNSINDTGTMRLMGQPGTSWCYEVPSLGAEILSHYDESGRAVTKKATEDDARLYPYRRLLIASETCIPYDGPAFNWHGELDMIPLSVDKWPWAPGGFGMIHDAYNIEKQLNALDSGIITRARAQNNPPLGYDLNSVTPKEAEAFDPMDTDNVRIGYDGESVEGTPFKLLVPFEVYKIFPEQLEYRKALMDSIDYTMQMRDIVELSKAKVLGKDMASLEQVLTSLGPIVRDIGLDMEESVGIVGRQIGSLIYQYMTTEQMMAYVGPQSMALETFDYKPGALYPSHLPDERVHDGDQKQVASKYSDQQRARWMASRAKFINLPGSMHDIHQMTTLLVAMQLKARQMHVSDYFCMSAANIPNVIAPAGNSEQERWKTEQEDNIYFQARMAVIAQTIAGDQNLGGGPPPGSPSPTKSGGRPPTAQAVPHLETRNGPNGIRPVVSESN